MNPVLFEMFDFGIGYTHFSKIRFEDVEKVRFTWYPFITEERSLNIYVACFQTAFLN